MIIELWPKAFFILLNSSLLLVIAYRIVRYTVIPSMRASLAMYTDEVQQVTSDISEQKVVLSAAKQHALTQEREIARLTSSVEKWTGVLSQRAATAEAEARDFAFRYKTRCQDNARARVNQRVQQKVTKRVLHDVRKALECVCADSKKQQQFMDHIWKRLTTKGTHDRI